MSTRPTIQDTTVDHTADEAAIRQIIADVETGFNTKDADLSVKHFIQNSNVVSVMGWRVQGWDALLQVSQKGLAGALADEIARYDVQDIIFLRPDVAIAYKRGLPVTRDGTVIEDEQGMIALYVLVKEEGQWWVAARQNTFTGLPHALYEQPDWRTGHLCPVLFYTLRVFKKWVGNL